MSPKKRSPEERQKMIEEQAAKLNAGVRRAKHNRSQDGARRSMGIIGKNQLQLIQKQLEASEKKVQELTEELNNTSAPAEVDELNGKIKELEEVVAGLKDHSLTYIDTSRILVSDAANRRPIFKRTVQFQTLVMQIENQGQTHPIGLKQIDHPDYDYELIWGNRRLSACIELDRPVLARLTDDSRREHLVHQFQENIRHDLSVFELGHTIRVMLDEGVYSSASELAKKENISEGKVSQLLALSYIPVEFQDKYLTVEMPKGEYVELDYMPLALLRKGVSAAFKKIDHQEAENLVSKFSAFDSAFFALKTWKAKAEFIITRLSNEERETKPESPINELSMSEEFKLGGRTIGSVKASRSSGIKVSISKRHYSDELAEEINEAVQNILSNRFG